MAETYNDETLFKNCTLFLTLISIPTYLSCRHTQAPYGRHFRHGWGPTLPSWLSWCLMESPAVISTLLIYSRGRHATSLKPLAFLSIFLIHYLHRTFIYPLRLLLSTPNPNSSQFPLSIAASAFVFNIFNSYVQARSISQYIDYNSQDSICFWVRFAIGVVIFGIGMEINTKADYYFLGLKKAGKGYRIPKGGLFEFVSCANYFGEIVEWFGWFVMNWSLASFGFFVYTCANLIPRACFHHSWYLVKFGDEYPKDRKIVIPFLY